jgi:hypothetical protein
MRDTPTDVAYSSRAAEIFAGAVARQLAFLPRREAADRRLHRVL